MQGPEEERAEVEKAEVEKAEEKKAEMERAEEERPEVETAEEERPEDLLMMRACSAEHGRGRPHTAQEL